LCTGSKKKQKMEKRMGVISQGNTAPENYPRKVLGETKKVNWERKIDLVSTFKNMLKHRGPGPGRGRNKIGMITTRREESEECRRKKTFDVQRKRVKAAGKGTLGPVGTGRTMHSTGRQEGNKWANTRGGTWQKKNHH